MATQQITPIKVVNGGSQALYPIDAVMTNTECAAWFAAHPEISAEQAAESMQNEACGKLYMVVPCTLKWVAQQITPELTQSLFTAAMVADKAFQAAVIRQFGRKHAGDMRYAPTAHNAETAAAAKAYHVAANAYLDAKQAIRSTEVR